METKMDDVSGIKSLGKGGSGSPYKLGAITPELLETFPNAFIGREYWVHFEQPEHSSLCPKTGAPDMSVITIDYVPDALCVESKSLKEYLGSFRNAGVFMETGTNNILTHLVALLKPIRMVVRGNYAPRGGIRTIVTCRYERDRGCVTESVLDHKIG